MGRPPRDDSASPFTRSPVIRTPELEASNGKPATLPPMKMDGAQDSLGVGSQAQPIAEGDPEPRDYLNGGVPHENMSPLLSNGSPKPGRPSPAPLEPGPSASTGALPENGRISPDTSFPGRRSVQFARENVHLDAPSHSRQGSWDGGDGTGKGRGASIMARLKESLQTGWSPSIPAAVDFDGPSASSSPTTARAANRVPHTLSEEGSDADADAEETADETALGEVVKTKKKQRRKRKHIREILSTPNTPRVDGDLDSPYRSRFGIKRRSTMPGLEEFRGGLSEGEGRDRLMSGAFTRRGSSFATAGESVGALGRHSRNRSALAGGISDLDAISPRRPSFAHFTGERASTFGAKKWAQMKQTMRLLLAEKNKQTFDYTKSAELLAELSAGTPAALIFASMIQRDEHGNKKIPVLLEQVKVTIRESSPWPDEDSERHWLFTIDLEYGSGPSMMKWTIRRTITEILNLHFRFKLSMRNDKHVHSRPDVAAAKRPNFPFSAFPYLRGVRGLDESDIEDAASDRDNETIGEATAGEGTAAEGDPLDSPRPRPAKKRSRMKSAFGTRRTDSGFSDPGDPATPNRALELATQRRRYIQRQQRELETYLQSMLAWLRFRADSNRMCRFLELSALGVRLAPEGGYHGKECFLHIQSSKGLDFRRAFTPKSAIARHTRKWFMVRQSYIVCTESPENMNVYDVYLVDSKFKILPRKDVLNKIAGKKEKQTVEEELNLPGNRPRGTHHTFTFTTAERKVTLFSRNQHQTQQFLESVQEMVDKTPWHQTNRFDSFAPVRKDVFAMWLVDGRDYMWNVSRAISQAKDVIYIHDWWLSPELYMRRPACISQKWRLDRLLQQKAKEGVKIFVIIYRSVDAATPIESEYTKFSLLNLHPNIFVQRSPHQWKKNQFFFAHHEKLCVVDHMVAFLGGIDLCYGRWDSPQHTITDDKPTGFEGQDNPKDADYCQLWPGKDYSNPRVSDFFRLGEPYEEMYDRTQTPRMPWHDVGMQVTGQPARDLTRHFIQRWNYLRRNRKPTRPIPFLLPPPDAKPNEDDTRGLSGTCEVQILRSAGRWSLGINENETSIQKAYISMIHESDHFVYMENQFFVTSTEVSGVKIINGIGDALVERIIRAHENDEKWRCVIMIPLLPGFEGKLDDNDAAALRLILECQYRSIARGEDSIFERLRAAGIEPADYIAVFSLRNWGKIGSNKVLVTEQVYIHAKTIIVDDRVALIGSANINERSMLGERDSEVAAVIRDKQLLWSRMGGKPYRVGTFPHTLRMRLMREHLGLDVDLIAEEERPAESLEDALLRQDQSAPKESVFEAGMDRMYGDDTEAPVAESSNAPQERLKSRTGAPQLNRLPSYNHEADEVQSMEVDTPTSNKGKSLEEAPAADKKTHQREVEGYGADHWQDARQRGLDEGRDTVFINGREILVRDIDAEGRGTVEHPKAGQSNRLSVPETSTDQLSVSSSTRPTMPPFDRRSTAQVGLPKTHNLPGLPLSDDTDIGGPPVYYDAAGNPTAQPTNPLPPGIRLPVPIDKDSMLDPVDPEFYDNLWARVAENNTRIYREVFRCVPDDLVTTWAEYSQYMDYGKRFAESMGGKQGEDTVHKPGHPTSKGTSGGAEITGPAAAAAETGSMRSVKSTRSKFNIFGSMRRKNKDQGAKPSSSHADEEFNEKEKRPMSTGGASIPGASTTANTAAGNTAQAPQDEEKSTLAQRQEQVPPPPPPKVPTVTPATPALLGEEQESMPFPVFEDGPLTGNSLVVPEKKERRTTFSDQEKPERPHANSSGNTPQRNASVRRRRRTTTRGSRGRLDVLTKQEAEELLNMVQGHLVMHPTEFCVVEDAKQNFLQGVDAVPPLQIYN